MTLNNGFGGTICANFWDIGSISHDLYLEGYRLLQKQAKRLNKP